MSIADLREGGGGIAVLGTVLYVYIKRYYLKIYNMRPSAMSMIAIQLMKKGTWHEIGTRDEIIVPNRYISIRSVFSKTLAILLCIC
jgi:hypothetical protein